MTDNSKTYTSVIDDCVDNSMDYIDINIYVTCPNGSEWRKTLSLNKRNGEAWDSATCYSEGKDTCFDEPTEHTPPIVTLMFNERFDEAAALLKAAYNRQTSVKDHAEEMLTVLKSVHVGLRDLICDPNAHDLKSLKAHVKHTIDKVEGRK